MAMSSQQIDQTLGAVVEDRWIFDSALLQAIERHAGVASCNASYTHSAGSC